MLTMAPMFKTRLLTPLLLAAFGITACSQPTDPAPVPEAVNGWIEYPLSDNTFTESTVSYLHGHYRISVPAGEALEYKLRMQQGDTVVYRWSVDMQLPGLLNVEFHGHTDREPGEDGCELIVVIDFVTIGLVTGYPADKFVTANSGSSGDVGSDGTMAAGSECDLAIRGIGKAACHHINHAGNGLCAVHQAVPALEYFGAFNHG